MSIAFELYEVDVEYLPPGYQEVICHIIFDVNMGDNFCHKSQMLAGGHKITTPYSLTYYPTVYRDRVSIDLKCYDLNVLKVLSCYIHNSYLTAKFH